MSKTGRPPKYPDGVMSTITLQIPADVKIYLIESAEATGLSMAEFISALVRRDRSS